MSVIFNANGLTTEGKPYTLNNNNISFDYAGEHHMSGAVSGNRIHGTWTWGDGAQHGAFSLTRQ